VTSLPLGSSTVTAIPSAAAKFHSATIESVPALSAGICPMSLPARRTSAVVIRGSWTVTVIPLSGSR